MHAEDADQEDQARVDDVAGNSRNVSSDNVCHDGEEEEKRLERREKEPGEKVGRINNRSGGRNKLQ